MTSEDFREKAEAREKAWLRSQARGPGRPATGADKMTGMDHREQDMPRGWVVSVPVWAGYLDEDPPEETSPESLLDVLKVGPKDYFIRVRGNSMEDAKIEDGDLVQIRPVRPGAVVPDGTMVLAEVDVSQAVGQRSGRLTLKRFYRVGTKIRLQPENSAMQPTIYAADDVIVRGSLIQVLRSSRPS
jgi:hypothetical protein